MEIGRDLGRLQHHDRMRPQMVVERIAQGIERHLAPEVEMRDLAQRMHAGIGPAGGLYRHRFAAERVDRLLQRLLHRRPVRLALPAAKRPAVIFEGQLVARHGRPSRVPTGTAKPRRNASAGIGRPPGRCTEVSARAPVPQATVRRSFSTSPGSRP